MSAATTCRRRAAAVTSVVRHATSPGVINPVLEMPTRWARLMVAVPRPTMAVFVTEIAVATPFGDFHDRAVLRLIDQQRVAIHCGDQYQGQQCIGNARLID